VKLSSAIMLGMQTLDLSGNDFNCDILGVAANAVGIPRAVWTQESIHARNESILDHWPWLAKQIPVEGKDYYQTRFVELSGHFDGEDGTLGDLLNYIRRIEPECGECNDYDCTCALAEEPLRQLDLELSSKDEDKEGLGIPSEKEIVDCKAARQPTEVPQAARESAPPPPPATSPISQEAADDFDGLNLNALPPSLRRAVMAGRLRKQASAGGAARDATPGIEAPHQEIHVDEADWRASTPGGRAERFAKWCRWKRFGRVLGWSWLASLGLMLLAMEIVSLSDPPWGFWLFSIPAALFLCTSAVGPLWLLWPYLWALRSAGAWQELYNELGRDPFNPFMAETRREFVMRLTALVIVFLVIPACLIAACDKWP
jgi:hypothetical protein